MPETLILNGRTRWSGRRSAALLLLVAAATLAVLFATSRAQANPNQVIGLDMTPGSGNTTSAAGVDTCVQVGVGASFEADVFATNLQSLTAYEFRIDFDPAILSLDNEAIDYNFLLTKDGGGALFPLSDEDKPGRWFIGAAEPSHPDSGSGTLARLRFNTLKAGTSTLTIAANPVFLRPILKGAQAVSVGDDNGDGYWDGGLSAGKVAVGQSCTGSTPLVTPAPTHVPNGTPKPTTPGSTPAPTGQAPMPTNAGGEPGESPGSNGNSGSEPGETSPPIVGNIDGSGGGGSSPTRAPGNAQNPDENGNDEGTGANQSDSGGSSSSTTAILAVIAVALAFIGAGVLIWLRRAGSEV